MKAPSTCPIDGHPVPRIRQKFCSPRCAQRGAALRKRRWRHARSGTRYWMATWLRRADNDERRARILRSRYFQGYRQRRRSSLQSKAAERSAA